jgi:hypothetical protein
MPPGHWPGDQEPFIIAKQPPSHVVDVDVHPMAASPILPPVGVQPQATGQPLQLKSILAHWKLEQLPGVGNVIVAHPGPNAVQLVYAAKLPAETVNALLTKSLQPLPEQGEMAHIVTFTSQSVLFLIYNAPFWAKACPPKMANSKTKSIFFMYWCF